MARMAAAVVLAEGNCFGQQGCATVVADGLNLVIPDLSPPLDVKAIKAESPNIGGLHPSIL